MAGSTADQDSALGSSDNRRSFFAVLAGALATLPPLLVGIAAFLSPLRRKAHSSQVRVALLDQVPADGRPRYFPVIADHVDAWNRYPEQRVGAVYLIRQEGDRQPVAFTAKCPHAGCFVGYTPGDLYFKCPCHTSEFNLDGTRVRGDDEVAPRGLDTLDVELREIDLADGGDVIEVWVDFVDFQTGRKEKIPTE